MTPIATDGNWVVPDGEVTSDVDEVWYSFQAVEGQTYQLESERGSLPDTVLRLIDVDQATVLIENDDDERVTGRLDSWIEWTCPASGTYYASVSAYMWDIGTFRLRIAQASEGEDPCNGGITLSDMPAATISYMPAGGTSDLSMCDWTVQCAAGQTVSLTFVQFETEARRDTVNLYDGTAESDAKIRGGNLSGDMASLPTTQFSSTGPAMMLAFASDGSGGPAARFEAMYECVGTDSSPPPPPPPTELPVDGTFVDGVVHEEGDEAVFQFTAQQGQTYQVETEQCVSSGEGPVCLEDTVMQLRGTDGVSVIAENDDDERVSGQLDSYIEWTCPASGVYFVTVRAFSSDIGTFQVSVTQASALNGGDPCGDGSGMDLSIEAAVISFQPSGGTDDNSICVWHLMCEPGEIVSLTFTEFETEEGYDWVSLHGGYVQRDNFVLAQMLNQADIGLTASHNDLITTQSGAFSDMPETHFTSLDEEVVDDPSMMTVSFISDESIGAEGFQASFVCIPNPNPESGRRRE